MGRTGTLLHQKTPEDAHPLTIGVAVITHNSQDHLKHCLPPLINSPLKPRIVVVNSSSPDNTVEVAKSMGVETLVIPRKEFNHGSTRERARQYLNTDIVVMVTPDAYLTSNSTLSTLIDPILKSEASATYARQLPHNDADFFEAFPRYFNYPAESYIRSFNDIKTFGPHTFFCSNSCAAYLNRALDDAGGFQPVLLGEDTLAVAAMLKKGHRIAYVAEATAKHSHRYSLKQEFKRSFDTGLMRKMYCSVLTCTHGNDTKRGSRFAKTMLSKTLSQCPLMLPYAIAQCFAKYAGYAIGRMSVSAPLWFKKRLSSQDFYW